MRSIAPRIAYDPGVRRIRMHSSAMISQFHHWILSDTNSGQSSLSVVIHGDDSTNLHSLVRQVADHLNEYDDQAENRWFAATEELITRIAGDVPNRRLLGLADPPPLRQPSIHEAFEALERHGHVVLPGLFPPYSLRHTGSFHAAVGICPSSPCHLRLDPELLGTTPLACIIGDVFLEWAHHHSNARCD